MFFQSGGGRKTTAAQGEKEMMAGGQKIHWSGQVALVTKIQNVFVWVFCFTLEWMCGCYEIIMVFVSCLAVTMIEKCTDIDSTFPQTVLWTLRNILMARRTQRPCLIEVSHGIMYKLFKRATTMPVVRGTVICSGEVEDCRQGCAWLVVLATNILKH